MEILREYGLMNDFLSSGMEVYISTIFPVMPFSDLDADSREMLDEKATSHIFALLKKTGDRYVFFDSLRRHSKGFVPYERNHELGLITKEELYRGLQMKFEMSVYQKSTDIPLYAGEYPYLFVKRFGRELTETSQPDGICEVSGLEAIKCFREYVTFHNRDLGRKSRQFSYKSEADILTWKLNDLACRRHLLGQWLVKQCDASKIKTFGKQLSSSANIIDMLVFELLREKVYPPIGVSTLEEILLELKKMESKLLETREMISEAELEDRCPHWK
ncbi:MAG: hypothetical protein HUJ69_09500 [Lachnospiraceae bacterium]|nr:hypothetical protein [Lachnospiraceae bacterium]